MARKLVFVCSGNTCRSPMAKAMLEKILASMDLDQTKAIEVSSAGIWALSAEGASREAIEVMGELGVDLTSHRAQAVDPLILEDAEWIVTMTRNHFDHLVNTYPHLANKLYTLHDFAGRQPGDVHDPFGKTAAHYRKCRDEIEGLIHEALRIRFC